MIFLLLLLVLIGLETTGTEAQSIGACYGQVANNLPPVAFVINMFEQNIIHKMRIYNPDQATLEASRGSLLSLVIGVPNEDIQSIANDISSANNWVQNNILKYTPGVNFRYIVVGNEINPSNDPTSQFVLRAMQNIYSALASANLQNQIKISTAINMGLLGSSYPPSAGAFSASAIPYITSIVGFLVNTEAPLLANVHPYFAYIGDPQNIPLDFALFKQQGNNAVGYQNLFDAQLDSVYAALEKVGGSSVKIVVSESGWPSAGGDVATIENARTYYSNLINHANSGNGTPLRPGQAIETYLFAMFDENQKPGAATEQHFGLFNPVGTSPKYILSFNK
ncbi:glucan endo-1,3-beta-glucosidase [Medicago truncatula]|uniref:glucan endo-1,3-beta-glucosidase n=1 Tax=Medicago truncatula TaxID=3880 RepID=UPI00196719AA|nr:glucan endo-1,3-beta-glucosidase [Medicago truncatula]